MKDQLGTCHGLSKLPYMRDSRRSIGIDDYIMTIKETEGFPENNTGYKHSDRVGLGAYNVDIHGMKNGPCKYPPYMNASLYEILPYYLPLRAFTNRDIDNLFLAGKTMA